MKKERNRTTRKSNSMLTSSIAKKTNFKKLLKSRTNRLRRNGKIRALQQP